ncbi:CAP domain-containing protein [Phytohabitans aurantiacus]|uniref:SCP domain-containing protein n=1 Tax=Phytohabitans aurantiacus TaxID=3016789 RepID=A0ABQ5QRX6_9ACTN|nr:hypothetical protein [Phytohabitans aurantiacus]GLH97149.1 hypothetical protein Pa4123_24240 [Phytohabitans aurantiacus]
MAPPVRSPRRIVTAALAAVAVVLTFLPVPPSAAAAEPDWLAEINLYREAAGLAPAVEDPALTAGIQKHLTYLRETPSQYLTGQYANLHLENPASPFYTPEGDAAGRASLLVFGAGTHGVTNVRIWLTGPFHGLGMLRAQLAKVAYAADPLTGTAALNVISGLDYTVPVAEEPILFPGPGVTTNLIAYSGNERPSPLETCGWEEDGWGGGVGLPIMVLLPEAPVAGITATLVADNGPDFSTANGSLCVVDQHTFHTTDTVYGPTGQSILEGDRAVFLLPREGLTWSRYHVKLQQPGRDPIEWSFVGAPPWSVSAGRSLVLHVGEAGGGTVMGNLTVTNPYRAGYTTVYPCKAGRPTASNNNYVAGQTIPNFVAVQPDANGDICVYTSGDTDLIWDQVAETGALAAHKAARLLDTRSGAKPRAGAVVKVRATTAGEQTVLANLTVTEPVGAGYTTAYPCLEGRPTASNNNYVRGETIPNFVAVKPDANGDVCVYTSNSAHLIWDQVAETDAFTAHNALRVHDTRTASKPGKGGTVRIHVADSAVGTVMGNLTVTEPVGAGYTTAYPCLEGRPTASNNNYVKGQTIPNFVAVRPDSNGDVCVYTSNSAHLIWDQVAETDAFTAHNAVRFYDTRAPRSFR